MMFRGSRQQARTMNSLGRNAVAKRRHQSSHRLIFFTVIGALVVTIIGIVLTAQNTVLDGAESLQFNQHALQQEDGDMHRDRLRHGAQKAERTNGNDIIEIAPKKQSDPLMLRSSIKTNLSDDFLLDEIVKWMKSNGADISKKLEVRRANPDDPTSVRGVFANQDMEKGETLFTIPWNALVHPKLTHRKDGSINHSGDYCETIELVYRDMKSPTPTPYGEYMKRQQRNYLPTMWSKAGKSLLQEVLGKRLSPSNELDTHLKHKYYDECEETQEELMKEAGYDEELYDHAVMMIECRADDELMVPLYDLLAHGNGPRHNTRHNVHYGRTFKLETNQFVEAGQELINSYNQCSNCGDWADSVTTPEMFRTFGFVENYPQRYTIRDRVDDEYRIKFDILLNDDTNELEAKFLVPLSKDGVTFMRTELRRLQSIARPEQKPETMPIWEWDGTWQMKEAYERAFEAALEKAKTTKLSEAVWTKTKRAWLRQPFESYRHAMEEEDEKASAASGD